jgi:putative Holliday junction resolvase
MIVMGVDFGSARTGIAVSDPRGVLASPVRILSETNGRERLVALARLAAAHGAERIVVGYPLNMDGSAGEKAQHCAAFAKKLSDAAGLPVVLQDERLSTVAAHQALNAANVCGNKRKKSVDAVAAVTILQTYLDKTRAEKPPK